jgi:hypothetical protein
MNRRKEEINLNINTLNNQSNNIKKQDGIRGDESWIFNKDLYK